jgi:hypothetical protein
MTVENIKTYWPAYLAGAAGGGALVMAATLMLGIVETSAASNARLAAAVMEREVSYCTVVAQALVASGAFEKPTRGNERNDLAHAALTQLVPDGTPDRATVRACARAMQANW